MFPKLKTCAAALCVWTMACLVKAQSPPLSVFLADPDFLQFSWPSNFTNWRLVSTTNLASGGWQPTPLAPSLSSNALSVLLPITDVKRYFRLQQTGAGSCVFQGTPQVINKGDSSTLSWCPLSGYTYFISPGPGAGGGAGEIVPGSSLVVSPTNTTIYTLTASNALGVARQDTTAIICNPCGWLQVSNLDAHLFFRYNFALSTPSYNFTILQAGAVRFHLQRMPGSTDTDAYFFGFSTPDPFYFISLDEALMNNREDDKTASPYIYTTTESGHGPTLHNVSYLSLHLTCTTYDFSYNVLINSTEVTQFGTTTSADGAATGAIGPRPIPVLGEYGDEINGEDQIPAEYPPSTAEYFVPSSDVGQRLFTTGTATAPNAGAAHVIWNFLPEP